MFKKIGLIVLAVVSLGTRLSAQTVDDALRYSQIFYGGTARFMSMGGAFTALGGDISSLSQNPAGIGVFRASEITITPQLFHSNVSAGFNNNITSDYLYNFNLNQAGIVSNLVSNENESGLITLNFGYSFNKTNNLNQTIRIDGTGTSSSMADYWALNSHGILGADLTGNERNAYDAWLIDTITGSGGTSYGTVFSNYGDNPTNQYGQSISRYITNEGYTGEHALSLGGNYSNKIYFGATFGISTVKYSSHFEHSETAEYDLDSKFRNFTYTDHYEQTGRGYSLKLGAIIKPIETVRIGIAFHSPTFYKIDEYFYEDLTSKFTDGGHYEFSNEPARYNYAIITPFRVLTGVAVQIRKFALLSADYEFVDYSIARFKQTGDDYDYSVKNSLIKNSLKSAGNIRLGGEFRLNKLYLRTGYGYYGKAFQAGEENGNMDFSSISFGTGFREQNVSIDFAFTNFRYSQKSVLYPLDDNYDPSTVNLSNVNNMFTLTVGYKFGY